MDLEQRIAQFENMAQADPSNEMAHFSLAGAYAQAGRHQDAADAYRRAIDAEPTMSKAYQLAGEQLLQAGRRDDAAELLTTGYTVAAENGDVMPKNAIADLLGSIGVATPDVEHDATEHIPEGSFLDHKSGRPGTQLAKPPFKGPLGEWIHAHISEQTWNEWIGQGTKVINELRLDLSKDEDAETYDRYMREFLGVDEELLERIRATSG